MRLTPDDDGGRLASLIHASATPPWPHGVARDERMVKRMRPLLPAGRWAPDRQARLGQE